MCTVCARRAYVHRIRSLIINTHCKEGENMGTSGDAQAHSKLQGQKKKRDNIRGLLYTLKIVNRIQHYGAGWQMEDGRQ
jgi:hypothetical protein